MRLKVAVVQESPVFFDKEKTLAKVEEVIQNCANKGCNLILFPESFVPGYPRGFTFGTKIGYRTEEGRKLFSEYYNQSFDLDSQDRERLEKLCKALGTYLVLGVTEKQNKNGTLYCSMVYFSPERGVLGVHRKIKPTALERLVWGEAGGEDLVSFDTRIGKLGGLICWENYMPLARMSMYKQGVEIYMAPTADAREEWTSTMRHIALEGRCYVLGCNQFITKSMLTEKYRNLLSDEPEVLSRGGSLIVSPLGEFLEGPLFDTAGILMADIDLEEVTKARMDMDVAGHYNRPDVFNFSVNGQPDLLDEQ